MSDYDLIIKNGTVISGDGKRFNHSDVAVRNGLIAEIAPDLRGGAHEIDASGKLVTPGFIDIHTHYDGHVTWESHLQPSTYHGITTAVIGNCGVGFAPCRPEDRDALIRLMDGVEDIPFPVLAEGLPWSWTSYPEYLDFLESREFDMDILGYLPHAALRVYVMGERGARREPATDDDIRQMCKLLSEALDAGALGLATSRTLFHRSSDGTPIPTLDSSDRELDQLLEVMKNKNKGVFQIVEDLAEKKGAFEGIVRFAELSHRPVTFSLGVNNRPPEIWSGILEGLEKAREKKLLIKAQVMPRAIGVMLGFDLTLNPFYTTKEFKALQQLPSSERLAALRDQDVKQQMIQEDMEEDPGLTLGKMVRDFDNIFVLGNPPAYEQSPEYSIGSLARSKDVSPESLAYDLMLEGNFLYLALANYPRGNLDVIGELLAHTDVVPGLGDGGAHATTICDASYSTFLLSYWGRDRDNGRLEIDYIINRLTHAQATFLGLKDRGRLEVGLRADINVIDMDNIGLYAPELQHDLPGGGKRLIQRSRGYEATIVKGVPVTIKGVPTGELPGRLYRA